MNKMQTLRVEFEPAGTAISVRLACVVYEVGSG